MHILRYNDVYQEKIESSRNRENSIARLILVNKYNPLSKDKNKNKKFYIPRLG